MQPTWQQENDSNIIDSAPFWMIQYKAPLIAGVILLLAAGIGYAAWQARQNFRETAASTELTTAVTTETKLQVARKYLGTEAAAVVLLSVASEQFDKKDYTGSVQSYALFLNNYPRHPLANMAKLGEAWALEATGKTTEALAAFVAVGTHKPTDSYNPVGLIEAARLYRDTKNIPAARQALNDCLRGYANTPYAQQAAEKMRELPAS